MINPVEKRVTVTLGDGVAVMRREGVRSSVVANVLGTVNDGAGLVKTIWLDRIVHQPSDSFVGWQATGAVVTELHRVG